MFNTTQEIHKKLALNEENLQHRCLPCLSTCHSSSFRAATSASSQLSPTSTSNKSLLTVLLRLVCGWPEGVHRKQDVWCTLTPCYSCEPEVRFIKDLPSWKHGLMSTTGSNGSDFSVTRLGSARLSNTMVFHTFIFVAFSSPAFSTPCSLVPIIPVPHFQHPHLIDFSLGETPTLQKISSKFIKFLRFCRHTTDSDSQKRLLHYLLSGGN